MIRVPLLAALAMGPTQETLPEASELLDRREGALGPSDARASVQLRIEGRLEMEGMAVSARFEERYLVTSASERVLVTLRMEGWGETTQGTDGTVTWSTDPGFGILVKEGVEQGPVRRMWAAQRSAPWRSLYGSAKTLGVVERDGRALYELEMQPREGKEERWYLDRTTNELARVAVVYPGPTGESLPMEFVLSDWKAVDGVLYPHRRVQEVKSGTPGDVQTSALMRIAYVCESIRHAPLEPGELAPPPPVAEAIRDPGKRAPRPSDNVLECKLETVAKQLVATVRLEIDAGKVSETLAGTLPEVMRTITEQGAEMAGPPFSRYHAIDTAKNRIDIEAGIPVKAPIKASGRVKPSELPAGRVATTWHVGSYHQLQQSYDRLEAWLAAQKLAARGGFWEVYWTDPGLEPDPSAWRTQILWPVD